MLQIQGSLPEQRKVQQFKQLQQLPYKINKTKQNSQNIPYIIRNPQQQSNITYKFDKMEKINNFNTFNKTMSLKNFTTICSLGQGSFSTVEKVLRHEDNQYYALKKVKYLELKDKDKKNALNQIRILASIENDNVIKYKEAFFDQKDRMLCVVMELAEGGDLGGKIKKKMERGEKFYQYQIWQIGRDIINGLAALHEHQILHRDLKPANIFFSSDSTAKLGDLNVSTLLKSDLAYTQTGTPYYASPQVWENLPYAYQCDIWSFGCIMYELCTFKKPFEGQNIQKLYEKVKKCKYQPLPSKFTGELRRAIEGCLKQRKKRIGLQELKRMFDMNNAPKSSGYRKCSSQTSLMETIKPPQNRKDFAFCLPKPKYSNKSQKSQPRTQTSLQKISSLLPSHPPTPSSSSSNRQKVQFSVQSPQKMQSQKYLPPYYQTPSICLQPSSVSYLAQSPSTSSLIQSPSSFREVISLQRLPQNDSGLGVLKVKRKGIRVMGVSRK